jgi:HNH endonuclease
MLHDGPCLTAVLDRLNFPRNGSNYQSLKKKIESLGLNPHEFIRSGYQLENLRRRPEPISSLLVADRIQNNVRLKQRLIKEGYLTEQCLRCGIGPSWNGDDLRLQLDHIDGDPRNNTIANLRLLCPNCHSQTATFGRKKRSPSLARKCVRCGARVSKFSTGFCAPCVRQHKRETAVPRTPPAPVLMDEVAATNYATTARKFGVSGNAIRKRIRKFVKWQASGILVRSAMG